MDMDFKRKQKFQRTVNQKLFDFLKDLKLKFQAMKRMIFAAVLIVSFCTVSFAQKVVAEGKTHTALGNYRIESASDPLTINGQEFKAYTISYENFPMEVTVAVCKERNCKKYYVLSGKLSVQYVCTDGYFGVQRLDRSFEASGYKTSDAALNRSAYFSQKVITHESNELNNTRLIAAYYPMLLKDFEYPVASK